MRAPVLLVGSVPLENATEVFEATCASVGDLVSRFPDGETGPRTNWIAWQRKAFQALPLLEPTNQREREYQLTPPFRLKPGADVNEVKFGPLGFYEEAIKSYNTFKGLKNQGRIGAAKRFQICLPTPFAPAFSFVAYESQDALFPRYEAAMLDELAAIVAEIPHEEIAIQWDIATEMSIWEQLYVPTFPDWRDEIVRRLVRLGEAVPDRAELGYHLCYGSMNNKHWKEPQDTSKLVEVANMISASQRRRIDWWHLPVPIDRSDEAYFAPLSDMRRASSTDLYLGLLHLSDGVDGARSRAAAAKHFVNDFGISTECGLGRWNRSVVPEWLALHRDAATALF